MKSCIICGNDISSGNEICQQCLAKQKMNNLQIKENTEYRKSINKLSCSRFDRFANQ